MSRCCGAGQFREQHAYAGAFQVGKVMRFWRSGTARVPLLGDVGPW
jgi:hypothetical protein